MRAPDRTSRSEDVVTMLLATWTIAGLLVDAYKHSTDPGLETFWTPWHGLFYSGFVATSTWLLILAFRRRSGSQSVLDAAPRAHRIALYGIGVFAVGGVGDAIWHTALGVEVGIDALLSPTHLLLWIGALMITSAPLRAAWSDVEHNDAQTLRRFAPVLTSLVITVTLVAFFLVYVWTPVETFRPRVNFNPETGFGEIEAALGVAGVMISTAVLMAPVLLASRRWTLPFGTVTILFTFVNIMMALGFDQDTTAVPAIALAGLVADGLIRAGTSRWLLAGLPPLVFWSGYFVLVGRLEPGIGWPPEVWSGAIVFAVLIGLAIEGGFNLVASSSVTRPSSVSAD